MGSGTRLIDTKKVVVGLHAVVPSSANPKWVSMRGYNHFTAIVSFTNTTVVTGSAIGFQQAMAVAGTGAKTLAFSKIFAWIDDSAWAVDTETFAVGNTFTTSAVNGKSGRYVIEVSADTLDVANGFNCIRATVGNAVATTIEVTYLLNPIARYGGGPEAFLDPLAN